MLQRRLFNLLWVDTRVKSWASFGENDFPEVMNPKVIHNPKDGKYYVVKESKMAEKTTKNLCTLGCDIGEYEDIPQNLPEGSVLKTPFCWYVVVQKGGSLISEYSIKGGFLNTTPSSNYVPEKSGLFLAGNPHIGDLSTIR